MDVVKTVTVKSWSAREASCHPSFMSTYLTVSQTCCPYLPTSTDKIVEKNSSFHVKQCTTGKFQSLFSRALFLVFTKFSFFEEDWAL